MNAINTINPKSTTNTKNKFPFFLLIIYLFFEYGRPQDFFPFLAPLHIPKITIATLALLLFTTKKINLKNPQTKCFLAMIALMVFHVPIAANNYWAFWMTYGQVAYFIVYLSIIAFVNDFKKLNLYIDLWILINLFCAFVGVKNGGRVPGSAFMGDENDFALVMNMVIPLAYFMFLETDSIKKKIFYLTACGLFIGANVASFSRGGFVGLLPVAAYCWYKTPRKALATIVMGLMLIIFLAFTTESYWAEMKTIKEQKMEEGTGAMRKHFWTCAWYMFLDHPIIGVGPGNFPWNIEKYEKKIGLYRNRMWGGAVAHSLYFTLIPELGLIGILLFSGMLYFSQKDKKLILNLEKEYLLRSNQRDTSWLQRDKDIIEQLHKIKFIIFGITGAVLGYLVSGAFLSVLYYPHFWLLIGLCVALRNIVQNQMINSNLFS